MSNQGVGAPPDRVKALLVLGVVAQHEDSYAEAERLFVDALSEARSIGDRESEAALLRRLAFLADFRGDVEKADRLVAQSLQELRALGAPRALAEALLQNALGASLRGDDNTTERLSTEALALSWSLQDTGRMAEALFGLGTLHLRMGRFGEAVDELLQSYTLRVARGDVRNAGATQSALGMAFLNQGKRAEARFHLTQSLKAIRESGGRLGIGIGLTLLAYVDAADSDLKRAKAHLRASIEIFIDIDNHVYTRWVLQGLAVVAALEQRWEGAARCVGAAEFYPAFGVGVAAIHPDAYARAIAETRRALGDSRFELARTAGHGMAARGEILSLAPIFQ